MKIKNILLVLSLTSAIAFGAAPSDAQVKETVRQTKRYLADKLKDPSSYKEGDWTIWLSKDRDGNIHVKCLHKYSATNGFGGRNHNTVLVSSPTPLVNRWHSTILDGYVVAGTDVGAMINENMKKELSVIPEKDIVRIKAKRILGGQEVD